MDSSSSSTSQTILIIILVIVAIILFIFFLVEAVNVPAVVVTPFADGTRIKIKSLANNKYLKPVSCKLIAGCNQAVTNFCTSTKNDGLIVAAIGQEDVDDPETIWQLCEYSSITVTGEAKYLIFSENNQNTLIMSTAPEGILTVIPSSVGNCIQNKSLNLCFTTDCATGTIPACGNLADPFSLEPNYFSFLLNERTTSVNNTTAGSYFITNACFVNTKLSCDGIGVLNLSSPGCPPVVNVPPSTAQCPNPNLPKCTLNFLFEIEPV